MIYAQFFQMSLGFVPNSIPPKPDPAYSKLMEASGDRSVVIIDGRLGMVTMKTIAADECKKRGYVAWQIFKGDSFTRSHAIGNIEMV